MKRATQAVDSTHESIKSGRSSRADTENVSVTALHEQLERAERQLLYLEKQ